MPDADRKICFAASECVPFAKTGGLADVCGSLPKALADDGCEVKLFMPLYKKIRLFDYGFEKVNSLSDVPVKLGNINVSFSVWKGKLPVSDVEVNLIDCPRYFHRETVYTGDHDEDERFILFQLAILETLQRFKWAPDIIHCNDWQTALIPVFLKTTYSWDKLFENSKTLLSIHNIGYQGAFSSASVGKANLSYSDYYQGGPLEFNGGFSFLKAGILHADVITTVSPTYAKEIQTSEYGAGLEGVLSARSNKLFGILNGIDTKTWDPAVDSYIRYNYNEDTLEFKLKNKVDLFKRIDRNFSPDILTIGIVSRLTTQKGFELLEPILPKLMESDIQFVLLGSGEDNYEKFFERVNYTFPEKFLTYIGYENELSHLITAGCDAMLMPSRYEPCGLNQMYALKYGTVPIVRKTGGLADTVLDNDEFSGTGNGFTFEIFSSEALLDAIGRAYELYKDKNEWDKVMRRGMREDFSWNRSAIKYIEIYSNLMSEAVSHAG